MKVLRDFTLLFKREFIHALRMPIWLAVGYFDTFAFILLYTRRCSKNWQAGRGFATVTSPRCVF